MPAQHEHARASGSGRPVQAARGGEVIAGRGADLADHQRAGIQPLLHRPQHVARIARLDQQHPLRRQPPTGQSERIGPAEIMGTVARAAHPDHRAKLVLLRQPATQHADLESQRGGCVEIARRADFMQARRKHQCVLTRQYGPGYRRFNRLDLASQLLELRPPCSDARRSWHVMASVECSTYVPFGVAKSQGGESARHGTGSGVQPVRVPPSPRGTDKGRAIH